jgi:hypothetical protein
MGANVPLQLRVASGETCPRRMTARTTVKPAALARNMARTIEATQFVVRREDAVRGLLISPSRTPYRQVPLPTNAQSGSENVPRVLSKIAYDEMAENSGYSREKARSGCEPSCHI